MRAPMVESMDFLQLAMTRNLSSWLVNESQLFVGGALQVLTLFKDMLHAVQGFFLRRITVALSVMTRKAWRYDGVMLLRSWLIGVFCWNWLFISSSN
jgi:hypothetical protein